MWRVCRAGLRARRGRRLFLRRGKQKQCVSRCCGFRSVGVWVWLVVLWSSGRVWRRTVRVWVCLLVRFVGERGSVVRRFWTVRREVRSVRNFRVFCGLTKLNLLKLYVTPVLTYADSSWAPFINSTQWRRIEAVQNIGLRTITGMQTFVSNKTLLRSSNFNTIQSSIRSQSKNMFYKNSFSRHDHIRLLGKTYSSPTTKKQLQPYPITWTEKPDN